MTPATPTTSVPTLTEMTVATSNARAEVAATTVDTSYVSEMTSSPSNAHPARGGIYAPAVLGAGHLVHVHKTEGETTLLTFSKGWTGVMDQAVPGGFTSHTAINEALAYWMNPASGELVPAVDRAGTPGRLYASVPGLQLVSGASHGGMVHYLGTLAGSSLLLHYRTAVGVLSFVSSDWVSASYPFVGNERQPVVNWNLGAFDSGDGLYIFGGDSEGRVYVQRRLYSQLSAVGYLSGTGWEMNDSALRPLTDKHGTTIKSAGPVSCARYYGDWYLSTVATTPTRTALFYRAKHPLAAWAKLEKSVPLADTSAQSAARFQSVPFNPEHVVVAGLPDVVAGLPFTYTVESATALRTEWDMLPVPRARL